MGSDRARVSDAPMQEYRSVVMQQGRVTLEADFNEEVAIAGEELLEETLDIVGPSGTPDNGYLITPLSTPPFDFSISQGTMYVGGLRVSTPAPGGGLPDLQYRQQTEWLDHSDSSGDADWVEPSQNPPTSEFIYLFLREQEVSAVEDSDFKDVALGGPDTAQRTRLIQHIARLSDGPDCASGMAAAIANWKSKGLDFKRQTTRLESTATLKVVIPGSGQPLDLCNPQAQGGYLGADNQLIRVQISGTDQATGKPKFVWGFDDASFLYRLDLDANNKKLLHLQSRPVDPSHNPRAKQAVEVLRSAALLSNGEYVASLSGVVLTLDKAYNPDTQMITLPAPLTKLPDEYYDSTQTPRVFLRVWEQEVIFTPGMPVGLGNTGLQVTLQAPGNIFHLGDYWLFAVRPSTPQQVYPERYRTGFQPPEGPRMWACPLGVITWTGQTGTTPVGTLTDDCRNPFDNLVDLTKRQQGCCTITIRPEDIRGRNTLQSIINRAASVTMNVSAADAGSAGNNIAVTISNARSGATLPTFDLTVTETDVYSSLSLSTIDAILGDVTTPTSGTRPGLALLVAPPSATAQIPANDQSVQLSGGQSSSSAAGNVHDGAGNVVFTLQAKKPGADGNLITAIITGVDTTNNTFTLSLTWTKTLTNLNLGNFMQSVSSNLAYEITATPPTGRTAFPAEGVTMLTGGTDGTPASGGVGGTPATAATGVIFGRPTKICLRPGKYRLSRALVLTQENSNLTIEGCPGGVTISVEKGQEREGKFILGLIQLNNTQNITFRDLTFEMPLIQFFQSGGFLAGLDAAGLQKLGEADLITLFTSIAMRAAGCHGLTVERCTFNYPAPRHEILFSVGVFAVGDCYDVNLSGNSFLGPNLTTEAFAVVAGYVQISSVQSGAFIPSILFNASFSHNVFENLDVGIFLFTLSLGITTFESNVMRSCLAGIVTGLMLSSAAQVTQSPSLIEDPAAQSAVTDLLASRLVQYGMSIAATYPLPDAYVPRQKIVLKAASSTPDSSREAGRRPKPAVESSATEFVPVKTVRPLTSRVFGAISGVNEAAAAIGIVEVDPTRLPSSSVDFTGNDIDAVIAGLPLTSFALFIVEIQKLGSGKVTMTANKLRNISKSFPTAFLLLLRSSKEETSACTVTGNVIENLQHAATDTAPKSLQLATGGSVAITGNVLVRRPVYPPRLGFTPPVRPPFDSWDFLNTVVP